MKEITPGMINALYALYRSIDDLYCDRSYTSIEKAYNTHPSLKTELANLVHLWNVQQGHGVAVLELGLEVEDDGSLDLSMPSHRPDVGKPMRYADSFDRNAEENPYG